MNQFQKKKTLVSKLNQYLRTLNVQKLWNEPDHKASKDWLAQVAVIFKNLDEGDYQAFENLRQHLYPSIQIPTRKHAAEQIDGYMRQKVAEYKAYDFTPSMSSTMLYVSQSIIDGFINKKDKFNYKKLIKLLNELNDSHSKGNQYASAMLIRAVLDHVPPLLGLITFEEVTSNYSWGTTDKQYVKGLLDFKNDAHDTLHRKISEDEDLFELHNLPNNNRFNRLLQECLKKGGDAEFAMAKEKESTKEYKTASKINISLIESGSQSWQNYSVSNYMTYSYKFVLDVDNFKSSKPDYISVYLQANSSHGLWKGEHYVFEGLNIPADEPYRIESEVQNKVTVCISDEAFNRGYQDHRFRPDIDEGTLVLTVITKSGATFKLPIKILHS